MVPSALTIGSVVYLVLPSFFLVVVVVRGMGLQLGVERPRGPMARPDGEERSSIGKR